MAAEANAKGLQPCLYIKPDFILFLLSSSSSYGQPFEDRRSWA